jgi:hypothetical protein
VSCACQGPHSLPHLTKKPLHRVLHSAIIADVSVQAFAPDPSATPRTLASPSTIKLNHGASGETGASSRRLEAEGSEGCVRRGVNASHRSSGPLLAQAESAPFEDQSHRAGVPRSPDPANAEQGGSDPKNTHNKGVSLPPPPTLGAATSGAGVASWPRPSHAYPEVQPTSLSRAHTEPGFPGQSSAQHQGFLVSLPSHKEGEQEGTHHHATSQPLHPSRFSGLPGAGGSSGHLPRLAQQASQPQPETAGSGGEAAASREEEAAQGAQAHRPPAPRLRLPDISNISGNERSWLSTPTVGPGQQAVPCQTCGHLLCPTCATILSHPAESGTGPPGAGAPMRPPGPAATDGLPHFTAPGLPGDTGPRRGAALSRLLLNRSNRQGPGVQARVLAWAGGSSLERTSQRLGASSIDRYRSLGQVSIPLQQDFTSDQ